MIQQSTHYLTKSQLKQNGWSDGLINTLLIAPDLIKTNPFNSRHPIQLFDTKRVKIAENNISFIERQERRAKHELVKKKHKIKEIDPISKNEETKELDFSSSVGSNMTFDEYIEWRSYIYDECRIESYNGSSKRMTILQ